MATLNLLSDEFVSAAIDSFVDADGNPQAVDAVEWRTSDDTVFTLNVTNGGMNIDVVAVDMPMDAPAKMATLSLHVTEAAVPDAITASWDVVVSSLSSPPAVGVNVTFGPAQKKNP